MIEINGKYYIFYHRHSNRKQSSRQAVAEEIRFENGKFYQAEMTSCGLNGEPLSGQGTYPSYIACNLYGKKGTRFLSMIKHPKKAILILLRRAVTGKVERISISPICVMEQLPDLNILILPAPKKSVSI